MVETGQTISEIGRITLQYQIYEIYTIFGMFDLSFPLALVAYEVILLKFV